jgi:hypothetical protein
MFDGVARVSALNSLVLSDTDVNYGKIDLTTANQPTTAFLSLLSLLILHILSSQASNNHINISWEVLVQDLLVMFDLNCRDPGDPARFHLTMSNDTRRKYRSRIYASSVVVPDGLLTICC